MLLKGAVRDQKVTCDEVFNLALNNPISFS